MIRPIRPIVWVHGDCLSPYSPALRAYPGAPALFVWDDELLAAYRLSLKRIVFITECLLELPVRIFRGDVAEAVLTFAAEHGADGIVTTESPSPRFAVISRHLGDQVPLLVLPVEPFVVARGSLDLRRFSRYWQAVAPDALSPGHSQEKSGTSEEVG
jgi:hypothetical protein